MSTASGDNTVEEADFVVVGSGAGGGPLAANLAAAGFTVTVLEAGHDHACSYYDIPVMQARASEDEHMRWDFYVRHYDDDIRNARDSKWIPEKSGVLYPRGSTVGGSTAISAMVHVAPHDSDWDAMADLTGDASWASGRMREIFERIENWQGADAAPLPGDDEAKRDEKAGHGRNGWLATTRADPALAGREPLFLDIIGAIESVSRARFDIAENVPLPRDINARDTSGAFEGMSFVPVAAGGGCRNGSRERLQNVRSEHPQLLRIMTNALATRILIEDGRAVGIEYSTGRDLYRASPGTGTEEPSGPGAIRAKYEVILAAGTFNTPQLLMLSGIGPREELERFGIDVIVDAPGVGSNMQDRYEVSVVSRLDRDYAIFDGSTLDVPASGEAPDALLREWLDSKGGPYSTNGSLAALVAKSAAAVHGETDLILFSLPIDFRGYYPGYSQDGVEFHNRLSTLVLKGYTNNRAGTVRLRSTDPRDVPDIRFRMFDEGSPGWDGDVDAVVDGIELAREIAASLQNGRVVEELVPGEDVTTRKELREFVQREAWGHHACGTAKIGSDDDPGAVLDSQFRVRGVKALRVVDASVFPGIPGFFIASAVYMVSEKASDVLIAEYASEHGRSSMRAVDGTQG